MLTQFSQGGFFSTFSLKMALKGLKMGLKLLDLVWFGLAWPVCDHRSWLNLKILFKFSKIAQLKVRFLGVGEEF